MIEISVSDTGPGIKSEDKSKLFKLFGFLEDTKELNPKGVGLGLHISQQICQQLGGEILVDSEVGQGAIFTFVIELDEPHLNEVTIKRNLNPEQKVYKKLKIDKRIQSNESFTFV